MGNLAITNRIEGLLSDKRIKKTRFYRECHISSGTYSMWKNDIVSPTDTSLRIIADYLNTTVEYLRTGEGQREKPSPETEGLSDAQKAVLKLFDSLDEQERRALLATAKALIASRQSPDDL